MADKTVSTNGIYKMISLSATTGANLGGVINDMEKEQLKGQVGIVVAGKGGNRIAVSSVPKKEKY